jgi:hypothetical protein
MPSEPQDKWAQYEVQPQANDKWAQYEETPQVTPNAFQNIQQSLDQNTATSPDEPLLETGLKRIVGGLGSMVVHPLDTAKAIAQGATPGSGSGMVDPTNPIFQRGVEAVQDYQNGGLPYALTKAAGDATAGLIGGKIIEGAGPRPLPGLTTPAEASADAITKAVRPSAKEAPEFSNNVERHFGDLQDYATRTGNPLAVSRDFVKAGQGAGEEANNFYHNNILAPNGKLLRPVSPNFEGEIHDPANPGTATLNSIDQRLKDINAEENLINKSTAGDTASAKRLKGLGTEKAELLDTLHKSLGDLNGIAPEDVALARQKGPALLDMADTIHRMDQSRLVAPEMDTVTGSKVRLAQQIYNHLRGGARAVADKDLVKANANSQISPKTLPPLNPQTPTTIPTTDFLHLNNLEQAAQDAAAERSARTTAFKAQRAATAAAQAKLEGEAARTIGRQNALNQKGLPPLQ